MKCISVNRQKAIITLTPWAPRGGKTPGLGIAPARGLLAGGGTRAPLLEEQVWSMKSVLISGFGRGFLHS